MTVRAAPTHGDETEVLAGLTFPDPFRSLENDRDPVVIAWQRTQNERADAYVAGVPGVDKLRARVARYPADLFIGHFEIPRFAGGRWFRKETAPGATQAHVIVADTPVGEGTVVVDAARYVDEQGRVPFISWTSPSPDGRLLAVGLCHDGSEANTIRVVDVRSGRPLDDKPPQLLMDDLAGGAQWLPDSSGFFYVALTGPREAFTLRVFRQEIGRPSRTEPEDLPWPPERRYIGVYVSRDGRWAVVVRENLRPNPVALLDLTRSGARWRPFVTGLTASVVGHIIGDEYVAVTDQDAPRGRVVAIQLAGPAPADPSTWRVLVPESDAVVRDVTPVGGVLYLHELVDTYARVRIVDLRGAEVGQVPLPGRGGLAVLGQPFALLPPRGHPDEYLFGFSTFTESIGLYRHRPGERSVVTLRPPEAHINAVVEDHWATSTEGTRVPYHLVRRPDVAATQPQPTLIYGYGGFNNAFTPRFPGAMAAFIDAGGVFVHAHLRGGSELGLRWWEGGRMAKKQNCYADLFAIAEDLIAQGRTGPDRLAVQGASNGGLLAGVAITQRPELWRAAVPRVPFLDILGSLRGTYGVFVVSRELGDPEDPDAVKRIASYSPYQLVRDGTPYPAVYLDAGDTDPRCPAWHGRKFAARLQEATSSGKPVLLRVWPNVGHGSATARDVELAQHTAWLAFVMDQLGMTIAFADGDGAGAAS